MLLAAMSLEGRNLYDNFCRGSQGSNLALANLLNACSFLQKASRNCHHLLLLASENKSFSY